jgi:two-component system, response regulator PdtaR
MKPDGAVTRDGALTRETVLLVEHEPVTRTGISRVLSNAGYRVVEVSRPDEAWIVLETLPDVGVLVADMDAPDGTNSLELARNVHERWPSIGLVITSSHVRHLRPCDIPGDGCFLPRPLPAETLLHEVGVAAHLIPLNRAGSGRMPLGLLDTR